MAKWILLAAVLISVQVHAQDLPARLEKIVKSHSIAKGNLGISVVDLTRVPQNEVYALNEQTEMIPASITKLATAAAVLQRLGSSYKFSTGLWTAGSARGAVLKGDLYLKGGGDSGFVSETMWFLVNEFVRTGITKIEGDIVVDDSDFDGVRTDSSRDPERVDRAYDAPVGAMSFNWNSVNIFIRPTEVGQPVGVHIDPLSNSFTIDNKAKTVKGAGNNLEVSRNGRRIVVRGSMGANLAEVAVYKNIDDPAEWSGENLVFFLSQRGIKVTGKVKDGKKPSSAKLIAKADSKPVSQSVADMLKFSNNYVAEMLAKNLASVGGQRPATLARGMAMIRDYMVETGIAADRFNLENPSGLSRKNKVRAHDMTKLLVHVQKQFPIFAEMLTALPFAGIDGTLKRRMKGTVAEGWVRAKTGNLSGVISLSGYAGHRDGSVRAFTFIFNGKGSDGENARALFDALAVELVE